jgi:threonine dehydratase
VEEAPHRDVAIVRSAAEPQTVAGGLLVSLGTVTFPILRAHADRIVTADDAAIVDTVRDWRERMKIVIEPSPALRARSH